MGRLQVSSAWELSPTVSTTDHGDAQAARNAGLFWVEQSRHETVNGVRRQVRKLTDRAREAAIPRDFRTDGRLKKQLFSSNKKLLFFRLALGWDFPMLDSQPPTTHPPNPGGILKNILPIIS